MTETSAAPISRRKKFLRRTAIGAAILVGYLVTSVPVGLFLYSLKSRMGIDVFRKTGFHAYMHCLQDQADRIGQEKKRPADAN